jgi:hypothetical protein
LGFPGKEVTGLITSFKGSNPLPSAQKGSEMPGIPNTLIGIVFFTIFTITGDPTWAMWGVINFFIAFMFVIYYGIK